MNDPSQPLPWPHVDTDPAAAGGPASGFLWPSPPYAAYPQPEVQRGPESCEILGLNNSRSMGQLLKLEAGERIVQINVPPARNSMPLKFSQFRAVKLLGTITVPPRDAGDMDSPLSVDQRPRSDFRVVFNGGDELKGVTIGHHHDNLGLFLFPPLSDSDDSVRRVFVPREVLAHFEIGERLGDMLLKDASSRPSSSMPRRSSRPACASAESATSSSTSRSSPPTSCCRPSSSRPACPWCASRGPAGAGAGHARAARAGPGAAARRPLGAAG